MLSQKNYSKKLSKIRKDILTASFEAEACHIGSALSCVVILCVLFYDIMKKGELFIFSKASGVATYYAILSDLGHFPKKKLAYYLKNYPECSKEVPGVIHSVGSVGHGLNVACGLALADRKRNVYCLISDGELQEGSTYEAALFARQHKLTNLYVICDNNGLQACGATSSILELSTAIKFFENTFPHFLSILTTKGAGVDFMENDYTWHYKNLTPLLLTEALQQV